jgi:presequence protease
MFTSLLRLHRPSTSASLSLIRNFSSIKKVIFPTHENFTLIKSVDIKDYDLSVGLYSHKRSGGQLLSVQSNDENKVFGITFRTPSDDSTGIAHILEHSVLCGSRKYQSKEPFADLLKGSLNTFLNAFTYPDRTCYPVASINTKDFYNLVDVYLDAVFRKSLHCSSLSHTLSVSSPYLCLYLS